MFYYKRKGEHNFFTVKMLSFWICFVVLLLFLPTNNSVPYPSSRCSKNDCSYQLQDFMNDTCMIFNTSVCLDFYNFEESSEETLNSEEESKFHVSIVPYTAELVKSGKHVVTTVSRSAINITLTISDIDIDKLVVKLYKKNVSSEPLCRIFDFHSVSSTKFPIYLFYDCWYNLAEFEMQNVRMDFIALPLKKKLSYNVFIPGTEYPGSCTWQPLIMVFRGNLCKGVVQVKFSRAPELYNVSSYMIKLTQHPSGDEKIVELTPEISRNMLLAQFSSIDRGIYSVSVKPVIRGVHHNCWTETDKFGVEIPKSYHMLTVYLCIFILLIFSAFVFYKMFRRNIPKLRFGLRRRILLLYSHDCNEHKEFVMAFIQYLIKYCHVEVFTIYEELPTDWNQHEKPVNIVLNVDECNPLEWIKKKYNDCDIIMFLISAGLFYILDSKHFRPIQKCHEWRQQLEWAMSIITSELKNNPEDFKKKNICKVCFQYSNEECIPDKIRSGFGKCYFLPKEMNNLINFMHDSGECCMYSNLCVTDFESSFENTDLYKKMRDVQTAVDSNSHIHFITPLSDMPAKDLNSIYEYENCDEISTISDSSDEDSDYAKKFLSENIPISSSKEIASLSYFDKIHPMGENEKNGDLAISDSGEDSGSEESDYNYYYSEIQAKDVIENILNKN